MTYNPDFIRNVIQSLNEVMFDLELTGKQINVTAVADIFRYGYCYYYAHLLKEIFPEAEIYSSRGHVLVKIDNFFYDSYGVVKNIKYAAGNDISSIARLFDTPYYDLSFEDKELVAYCYSLYCKNSTERLRRIECEEWFIPNLAIAMEMIREKYELPKYEPKESSLFYRKL